jgi:hypothetical protein
MQRRIFIIGSVITTLGPPAPSIGWELVPPDEEREEELIKPPTIQVIRPDLAKPISGPVDDPNRLSDATWRLEVTSTFVATYGFLGLDITGRLLQHANLTPQGITAREVSIPRGQHNITLSVADTMGRVAKRTVQLTVL